MVYTRAEQHEPAPTIHTMHTTHTIHSTQTLYITLFRANNNKCRNILRTLKGKGVGRTHTTPTLHTTRISVRHISHMLYIIYISRHTLYITLFRASNNKCRNILRALKGKGVGRTHTTPTLQTTRISLRHISHMLYIIHISRHISRTLEQVITTPNNILAQTV